jgi:uncharacterized protein (DUF1015 family)
MTRSALLSPFAGLRPPPERAADVAAPPYDVVDDEEARALARGRPWSFLHISKPVIDLPPGTDPYSPPVYRKARENFDALRAAGILRRDPDPCYYVYRLTMGDHRQTGVVGVAPVECYRQGRIRRHELTQPGKEDDRVRQIDALDAQTGPAIAIHRPHPALKSLLRAVVEAGPAAADIRLADGVRHELWVVDAPGSRDRIAACFGAVAPSAGGTAGGEAATAVDLLYIADGHHRSAAAERVAGIRRERNSGHTGEEPYNYFLAVAFPTDEMQVLDYNRLIRDTGGLSAAALLEQMQQRWQVELSPQPVRPDDAEQVGLYMAGRWYRLRLRPGFVPPADAVGRLAVSLLHDHLIEPLLGIQDERRDPRIDFVGGVRGLGELSRRVDSGEMALAFSLRPTSVDELIAVADAGLIMPPKSTWFEPKLADGLVSHLIGGGR